MSNDLRQAALAAALQFGHAETAAELVKNGAAFLGFLTGAETKIEAAPAAKPAVKPVPPAKVIPVTGTKATTKAAAADEGVESDAPTAEDVGKKINELLAADKQPEALAALKKYGAKSKSTLPVEHYADFIADADKILMDA
jgi:hypothetical protein